MDIFSYAREEKMKKDGPLARRMSPRSLDEFVGQEHLLGENMPLRRAVEGDLFSSFYFLWPPRYRENCAGQDYCHKHQGKIRQIKCRYRRRQRRTRGY